MVLACFGVAAFYDLLRGEYGLRPGNAALAAGCLALNPLFFLLATTYQTDVPALAFSLIALALYARGLRRLRLRWWAAGSVAALLAVTTRQNALVVPVVAGLLLSRQPELRRRPTWWLTGALIPAAACLGVNCWFEQRPDVWRAGPMVPTVLRVFFVAFVAVHAMGLYALPLLWQPRRGPWLPFFSAASALLAAASCVYAFRDLWGLFPSLGNLLGVPGFVRVFGFVLRLYPYLGNMLTPWGQFSAPDDVVVGIRPLLLEPAARLVLTVAGCLAGASLLARLRDCRHQAVGFRPLFLFSMVHFPFLLISPFLFDRYFLVFLPGALCLAAGTGGGLSRWAWRAEVITLGAVGVLSACLIHDWLAWNSARWELGRRALGRGIPPAEIEGGFEWDAWFSPDGEVPGFDPRPRGLTLPFTRCYFADVTGRFALAFSEPPGTRTLDTEPYRLWLIPGERRFFLVEQQPAGKKPP